RGPEAGEEVQGAQARVEGNGDEPDRPRDREEHERAPDQERPERGREERPHHSPAQARRKAPKTRRWWPESIRSGCHCTPRQKAPCARSIASTTPSPARAAIRSPAPGSATAW